jgi:hypothetical protein
VIGKPFTASNNSMGATGGGLREEKGDMDQNHDSNAALSGMWNIDYYHGPNKVVKGVVNGWTISSAAYFISGAPFTVLTGSNKNFDSAGSSRPNYNTVTPVSPKLSPHRCRVCATNSVTSAWFNNAAFTANGPTGSNPNAPLGGIGPGGADGNVGRDSLNGPGLKDMDMGLLRDIHLPRGTVFQFRAEITNVMNWVNLGQPSSGNITAAAQGTITSAAGTQRVIQLGGRLNF